MAGSEPDPCFDIDEIEKLFLRSKSQGNSFNFGFGLTSKPAECVLIVHLRKPGKALKKAVKDTPARVSKACYGSFRVDGGDVLFSPAKPVKGMILQLKKRFRDAGLKKYKPVLLGADGAVLDEDTLPDTDIDDDDDDDLDFDETGEAEGADDTAAEAPEAETGETPADDEVLAALKRRLAAAVAQVKGLSPELAGPLGKACVAAGQQIAKGDAEAAEVSLGKIEAALARVAPGGAAGGAADGAPAGQAQEKLQAALAKLAARIKALPDGPSKATLAGQAREIMGHIGDGQVERAVLGLQTLQRDIAAAEAAPPDAARAARDPLQVWTGAKDGVDQSLEKLRAALLDFDDPDLKRIAELGLFGLSDGNQVKLAAAMRDFTGAAPNVRPTAAQKLIKEVEATRQTLSGNRLVDLCENNPFGVAIDIRGPLGRALDTIETIARG